MKKIDAHLHIAKVIAGYCRRGELRAIGNGKAQWGNGEIFDLIPKDFGDSSIEIESAIKIMDSHDVEKAVLMQGSMYGFQNNYHLEILNKYPNKFCPSCTVDPFMTNYLETITNYIEQKNFRLAKFEVSSGGGLMGCHDTFSLVDDKMLKIYSMLEKNNAVLALDIGDESMPSHQPDNVLEIAKMFPKLNVVVCHLLAPDANNVEVTYKKLEKMNRENIFFDLAALPKIIAIEEYPYKKTAEIIKTAANIITDKRLLWGSDAPFAAVGESYEHLADYIGKSELFTVNELDNIFYNNANKLFF